MRIIGRGSAGVRLFNVADDEHVVSAAKIGDSDGEDESDDVADIADIPAQKSGDDEGGTEPNSDEA
jgi:DNA gyrase subunit A